MVSVLKNKGKFFGFVFFVFFTSAVFFEPAGFAKDVSEDAQWIFDNIFEKNLNPQESLAVFNSAIYPARSYRRFLWAENLPEDIRRRYVLYPRFSQEPLEDYRPFFFNILADSLDSCSDTREAVERIFRWTSSVLKFRQTSRRDQGPLETYYSGFGRCEELMIFSASICRTFGIPARQAYVPYWSFTDNNHAWTEVYIGGDWHYIDEGAVLDRTWFTEYLQKTALILAIAPGKPEGEEVVRIFSDASLINRTGAYAPAGTLAFYVTDGDVPVEFSKVSIYAYNWGALRELIWLKTGEDGKVYLTCGIVSVFALAEKDGKKAFGVFEPLKDDTLVCSLSLKEYMYPDTLFYMRVR
ncbi:transglutaminase domain-containing protein [candidate division WOR-3 bacterium]|nr:transglutaminase domain-containing protein [candidate division WOR-3 bacterium]